MIEWRKQKTEEFVMYIIKNALRCIGRSKGRNVLIGIIALVIAISACIGLSIRQAAESALDLLESVGLDEDEANRRVLKLSGGQQQRVAIARALSYDPDIILADEPTGNLDRDTQKEIMDIFRELTNQDKCVILVSHSPDVAEMCDERYELIKISGKNGRRTNQS
jgi:putative ABC transport system ATP-binding protein